MQSAAQQRQLANELVTLEPVGTNNLELLIRWTLDPVAQGPHKNVPKMGASELRTLFLHSSGRSYFLIRKTDGGAALGRFYFRAWRFNTDVRLIDWELNIFIADPRERGKGYGTAAQGLGLAHLMAQPTTHSVFACTQLLNVAEQRSLEKVGLVKIGMLPHAYYRVPPPADKVVLYAKNRA